MAGVLATALATSATITSAASGRLIATGGATQIEGSAGGGLVPWAVLSSYAVEDEIGATAFATRVDVKDYVLDSYGVAANWHNRIELSLARDRFQLGTLGDALGMPGAVLRQDVFGAKLRLTGDVIYSAWPQISLGVQRKHNLDFAVPSAVGARSDRGTDIYLAATKVFLGAAAGYNLLLNATARSTDANQIGILGFGGDRGGRRIVGEYSAAVLFNPRFAIGAEYRQKPDNLGFAREDAFRDIFVAWFPNKHVAVVGAWAELGSIATLDGQRGWYLSVQASL
ncbi:MAG: DUF3034 family protein [Dokdonella sp.]